MASHGPTLLGVDVIWVATLLAAVATLAAIFALYMALTVRDPMASRVKALNERREQLKAGIIASTGKRRVKNNLCETVTISQVHEDQAAVVAALPNPPTEGDFLP